MKYIKNNLPKIQNIRFYTQLFFSVLVIYIGIEFYFYVDWLKSGDITKYIEKPAGVESFLPISSLMSLYYLLITGNFHQIHPAGLVIFIAILTVSFFWGKSFCSWICPFGFISELIGVSGEQFLKKIFNVKLSIPKIIDIPLRSIKYLLLFFFLYSILSMSQPALKMFLDSSYNIMADVKMWYFFADITRFSLIVISILFVMSIFFRNFWCRYLCPYGALLGIFSLFSFNKIKRNENSCIDCNLCSKACPSKINVAKVKTVWSDECNSCLSCVDACPVKDTLFVANIITQKKLNKTRVALGIISVFLFIILIGKVTNNWHGNIPKEKYLELHNEINQLGHPKSLNDINQLNQSAMNSNKQK